MKRFLLLLLILATPARADDSISAFQWNSTKNTFQAMTRALGWKDVPDSEVQSFSCVLTGPWASGQTVTFVATRSGNIVGISSPAMSAAAAALGTATSSAGCIPASLRPTTTFYQTCVWATSGGIVQIYKSVDKTAWSAGSTNGWNAFNCSYSIK